MVNALVERLWLLERADMRSSARDVCRFMGALAVLSPGAIHVLFVRSPEAHTMLGRPSLRFELERYAVAFTTLDDAIRWADEKKHVWMTQGWTEVDIDVAHGPKIRRIVHEQGAEAPRFLGEDSRRDSVHSHGQVSLRLGLVHRGVGSGVDDHLGPCSGNEIGDAVARKIERRSIGGDDVVEQALEIPADLAVAAGEQDPHG